MGEMPKPMLIKKNSDGMTMIEESKIDNSLTIERVRELQGLNPELGTQLRKLESLPTHEKILWLKLKIDKMTPNVTAGANQITVSRENILSDSLQAFKTLHNPRRDLQVTF